MKHSIDTGNEHPILATLQTNAAKVQSLIKDMLQKNIIQPSSSPWASPVVLVRIKRQLSVILHGLSQAECHHS